MRNFVFWSQLIFSSIFTFSTLDLSAKEPCSYLITQIIDSKIKLDEIRSTRLIVEDNDGGRTYILGDKEVRSDETLLITYPSGKQTKAKLEYSTNYKTTGFHEMRVVKYDAKIPVTLNNGIHAKVRVDQLDKKTSSLISYSRTSDFLTRGEEYNPEEFLYQIRNRRDLYGWPTLSKPDVRNSPQNINLDLNIITDPSEVYYEKPSKKNSPNDSIIWQTFIKYRHDVSDNKQGSITSVFFTRKTALIKWPDQTIERVKAEIQTIKVSEADREGPAIIMQELFITLRVDEGFVARINIDDIEELPLLKFNLED